MANVYYTQAKYPEALKLHEDVLAIRVAKLGLEHPVAADTLYNIALVHRQQGRHDLEAECVDKCVVIYEKVYGNEHSKTANARKKQQGLAQCSPAQSIAARSM